MVDEIDSIAPKRDEKTADHKISTLSTLLSLFQGINDVPNITMIGSTNLYEKMDEAFLRRIALRVFVGRPSQDERLEMMKEHFENYKICISQTNTLNFVKQYTTNFTASAVSGFISSIITKRKLSEPDLQVEWIPSDKEIFESADFAANVSNIKIANESFPSFLKKTFHFKAINLNILKPLLNEKASKTNNLRKNQKYKDLLLERQKEWGDDRFKIITETGRILVDLCQMSSIDYEFECHNNLLNKKELLSYSYNNKGFEKKFCLLASLVLFSNSLSCNYIHLIDLEWLHSNSNFTDEKKLEMLTSVINESRQYKRSMIIFDVDSLVSSQENVSESNMGVSTSYSLSDNKNFGIIVQAMKKSFIEEKGKQHWVVCITESSYIRDRLKNALSWKKNQKQRQQEEKEKKENTPKNCITCKKKISLYFFSFNTNETSFINRWTFFCSCREQV